MSLFSARETVVRQRSRLDSAVALLANARRVTVLTGAGVSTDSGIPDYRGVGTPVKRPISIETFLASEEARRRYWAGSHLGWGFFNRVVPNESHVAISAMQRLGIVDEVVTQNVDALHERAGTAKVSHLHGTLDTVSCLDCGTHFPRGIIGAWMAEANQSFFAEHEGLRPDGDVEVTPGADFAIPACPVCGGLLKPDVVFFGELVAPDIINHAYAAIDESDVLLAAGTSLAVNTGMRLLHRARKNGIPIIIVNRGVTKGDKLAAVRLEGSTSEILPDIVAALA